MPDFIPAREGLLLTFARHFSTMLTAEYAAYGLILSDATNLASLLSAFETSYLAATNPVTRTKARIVQKNLDKENLINALRSLSARIQANPGVTPTQITDIGLPLHDHLPTPIIAPTTRPVMMPLGVSGTQQVFSITDEATPFTRAKPYGVIGCEVWVFLGEHPAPDLAGWISKGIATRSTFTITYDEVDNGKIVSVRGRWFNPRGEFGPLGEIVTARIAGALPVAA